MSEMQDFELFSSASNSVVARYIGRNYPGVLLQGDTLRILLSDIEELRSELSSGDLEAASGIAEALKEQLTEVLNHYEKVLNHHGVELPYMNSVNSNK